MSKGPKDYLNDFRNELEKSNPGCVVIPYNPVKKLRIIRQEGEKTEVLGMVALTHDLTEQKIVVIKSKEIPKERELWELSKELDCIILSLPNDADLSVYSFELVEE